MGCQASLGGVAQAMHDDMVAELTPRLDAIKGSFHFIMQDQPVILPLTRQPRKRC